MKLFIITGTCGAGKSTMKDELAFRLDPNRYAYVDSDETGLNWWDYAGTEREWQYGADSLREAFRIAHGRNALFETPMPEYNISDNGIMVRCNANALYLQLMNENRLGIDESILRRFA